MSDRDQSQNEVDEQAASPSLKEQLEAAMSERDENRDRWLRTQAEFENFRKRAAREADDARKYQAQPLASDLLPVLDNLRRAIQAGTSTSAEELLQGVQMVSKQFEEALRRHGLKPIEAVGKPLDPHLHEAITQMPSANHPPMTVLQEVESGYTLNDRVVRPSKVIVSSGPPA